MILSRKLGLLGLAASLWMLQLGCGDQYRPVANPIISPGGQPQVSHYAWVVNFNPNGQGTTTEINVSGDSNLAVNSFGRGTIAEAFPPFSLALFVANRDNDTVSEYLPTLAGAITTISLLTGSRPIFLNSAQNGMMYVLNSGANSACPNSGSVSTIPLATLAVSNTTCLSFTRADGTVVNGTSPVTMAQSSANSYIYILTQDNGGAVFVFNPAVSAITGVITPQLGGLGQSPSAIVASTTGSYIFIATQGDGVHAGALDIVTAGAAAVAASVPLGVLPTFAVVDPVLNRLYVANSGDNTVSVFDSSNINVTGMPPIPLLATVPVGTNPIGVTALANSTLFYVANSGSDDVTVVSANSFSPLATVPLPSGANPVFIASDPSSSKVYVADQGTGETTIIRTVDNTVTQNLAAPPQDPSCTSSCALQQPMMIVSE
jgi:YVTN family beta-propeller protein